MIFIDSDVFVRDLRYRRDEHFADNARFLDQLKKRKTTACTSIFNVLEVCGILSFNLNESDLRDLYRGFTAHYGVKVVFPAHNDGDLNYDIPKIFLQMAKKQCLSDAQISYVVERFSGKIKKFVTWNAIHFVGKISVPVLTPKEMMKDVRSNRR